MMSENLQVRLVQVEPGSAGQRLDNFLLNRLKGCPRPLIYRIIRKGEVRVNGGRAKPESRLSAGDQVRIPPVRLPSRDQPPTPGEGLATLLLKRILHDDANFLVIDKPAGLAVHGGSGVRLGLIEAMRQIRPQWQTLELVHRLDRDTSGCLVISKNTIFLKEINKQFKQKSLSKVYLALVQGYWPDSLQQVNAPLQKYRLDSGEGRVRVDPDGKQALTHFRVIERFGRQATLVEARLETGRTHQIRVHCRHAGHPILGDEKYGGRNLSEPLSQVSRLCLHALRLEFHYPADGPLYSFEAGMDQDLLSIVNLLRKKKKVD